MHLKVPENPEAGTLLLSFIVVLSGSVLRRTAIQCPGQCQLEKLVHTQNHTIQEQLRWAGQQLMSL